MYHEQPESWGVEFEKAPSGFASRTREGEGKSFDDFDPEHHPVALINHVLDTLVFDGDDTFMTRPQVQAMEAVRDSEAERSEDRAWAAEQVIKHEKDARKVNNFQPGIALLIDIPEAHPEIDKEKYAALAQKITEKLYKSAGTSSERETPVPRITALELRKALVDLKADLLHAGIHDIIEE